MGFVILALIAAAGLLASMACHVMGWLHWEPPGGKAVFVLHVGFLILWIPLVIFANRTRPAPAKGNLEHLLAELPGWARLAVSALFVYALLNFAFFLYATRQYPRHGVPLSLELRGFSGHWMLFYGVAFAGFVALARLARKRRQKDVVIRAGSGKLGP
jgi:hypothetical protein